MIDVPLSAPEVVGREFICPACTFVHIAPEACEFYTKP